jgi:2-haloacid dehalogenase
MSATLTGARAVVFDAYGTLFDVNAAASASRDVLGERFQPLADLWRKKQLEYTWLRTLLGAHADFWQLTGDALDFALEAMQIEAPGLRARLLDAYARLEAYPDAAPALSALRAAKVRTAILSNGTPRMLASATRSAHLDGLIDEVISVEAVGLYKPHPSVYRLATDRLGLWPAELVFVSANGWDVHGAKAAGLRVVWCNRSGAPRERLPGTPDLELSSLAGLAQGLGQPEPTQAST